jgi:pimeloyl-ACP methyl ester carboxylesterase
MSQRRVDRHRPDRVTGSSSFGPFQVHWEEHGPQEGPLVLLLHGVYAGASSYEWREVVPLLAQDRRVRVPDLLGFGNSDRPDLEWTPEVLTRVVASLIDEAYAIDEDAVIVASSLTAAHAVRARRGRSGGPLVLITPTGLGAAQNGTSGTVGRLLYDVGRHTPIGDLLVSVLSSAPSIRWFQRHQTYQDPEVLTEEEVQQTRATARLRNAKHAQLAFVANRLGLALGPDEVATLAPRVLWGSGQRFVDPSDPDRWRAAGAHVTVVEDGLPQVEHPASTVEFILAER